jgi:hypothetical protein
MVAIVRRRLLALDSIEVERELFLTLYEDGWK